MSAHAIGKREAKRTQSLRPSVASSVSSPPTAGVAEQARRSEERACTRTSSGLASAHDSQWEDAPPATPVGVPRADGRGDSQAEQLVVESTPPVEARGHRSWLGSGPHHRVRVSEFQIHRVRVSELGFQSRTAFIPVCPFLFLFDLAVSFLECS